MEFKSQGELLYADLFWSATREYPHVHDVCKPASPASVSIVRKMLKSQEGLLSSNSMKIKD